MRFPNHDSGVWGAGPGIWLPLQPCTVLGNSAQFAEMRLRPKRHSFLTRCPSPRPVLHLLATTSTPGCQSPWLLGVQGREGPDPSPGHAREKEREACSVGGRGGRRVTCIRVCQYSRTTHTHTQAASATAVLMPWQQGVDCYFLQTHQHNLLLILLRRLRAAITEAAPATRGLICYLDCKNSGNKTSRTHFIKGTCHPLGLQASLHPIKHRGWG